MIELVKDPERIEPESVSHSTWVCSRHPVVFEFERRDYRYFGLTQVSPATSTFPGTFQFFINNPTDVLPGGLYIIPDSGESSLQNVQALNLGTQTLIRGNGDLSMVSSTGTIVSNSRENYQLKVNIKILSKLFGLVFYPSPSGKIKADIQAVLNQFMLKEFSFNYGVLNKLDKNVYCDFTVSYTESWKGNEGTEVFINKQYHAVDAVKYLLAPFGQNLLDYLLQSAETGYKPKFLTSFIKPCFFLGYPFSLGFIYPLELQSATMTSEENRLDSAGNLLGATNKAIDTSQAGGVNYLSLINDVAGGPINPSGTEFIDIYLKVGGIEQRGYVATGYRAVGYTELVPPDPGGTTYNATETKRVKVIYPSSSCTPSAVDTEIYLRWRNKLGSYDYWLFQKKQEYDQENKINGTVSAEPLDLEKASYRSFTTGSESGMKITMGGKIAVEDWAGLKDIEASPLIEMLIDRVTNKFIRVQIVPRGFNKESNSLSADVEITIALPEYYTIPN